MSQQETCRGAVATCVLGGRRRWGGFGATAMASLSLGPQHAGEARFVGHIDPFVSKHWHDARRWQLGEARLVGDLQNLLPFRLTQCMGGRATDGLRPAVSALKTFAALPALQGPHGDARLGTGALQPRPVAVRFAYRTSNTLAIFQGNHSSPPGGTIAASFFDSTRSAVVSASAFSLRLRSFSNSLIRRRSWRVSSGIARASSG